MTWFKPKSEYPQTVTLAVDQGANCDSNADCSTPTPTCTRLFIGRGYQSRCTRNEDFRLDQPTTLPALDGRMGDTIVGVNYYPDAGDVVDLNATPRSGSAQSRFNRRFGRHGHRLQDQNPREEPDHVLDLDWHGADDFSNLWPLEASLNQAAGRSQNLNQRITFAEDDQGGTVHENMTLRSFKQQGFHKRTPPHQFFLITQVRRP